MLILELEIIEEMIVSLFLMFFAVAVSLILTKLKSYLSERTTISSRDVIRPTLTRSYYLPTLLSSC